MLAKLKHSENLGYWVVAIILSVLGASIAWTESWLPTLIPVVVLFVAWAIRDMRNVFYLIFATLPFSMEFYFESIGIGTDLPSEPLMIFFTGLTLIFFTYKKFRIDVRYLQDGLTLLLFLHVTWIFTTTLTSANMLTSFKYFLAKIWYVFPFFLFPLLYFTRVHEFTRVYKILIICLSISISIVLIRHAFEGFSFASSYDVVRPFFRNHVSYAAISVVCLPFVWAFYKTSVPGSARKKLLLFIFMVFLTGIYFSYTRAAILSAFFAWIAYYIFANKWVKYALALTFSAALALVVYLAVDNKYLDLTPNFERTITHTQFDNLIEATYKLEDISSMERIYRWMAGIEMIKDRPFFGFGPANFYDNYQQYSISQFMTYVSDNPEKSGIHNYFLMILVEQGLPGFILFILLCVFILVNLENIYHQYKHSREGYWIMALALSFIILFSMNLINDLIETDKAGPFFFLNMAALLFFKYKRSSTAISSENN